MSVWHCGVNVYASIRIPAIRYLSKGKARRRREEPPVRIPLTHTAAVAPPSPPPRVARRAAALHIRPVAGTQRATAAGAARQGRQTQAAPIASRAVAGESHMARRPCGGRWACPRRFPLRRCRSNGPRRRSRRLLLPSPPPLPSPSFLRSSHRRLHASPPAVASSTARALAAPRAYRGHLREHHRAIASASRGRAGLGVRELRVIHFGASQRARVEAEATRSAAAGLVASACAQLACTVPT